MTQTTPFSATVWYRSDEVVLTLTGEIDTSSAPRFGKAVGRLGGPDKALVFDLTGVTFLNSAGLSVIAGTLRRLERVGGRLIIRGASPRIHRVLEVSGFGDCELVEITGIKPYFQTIAAS